jgi:hypothetical protein
VTDGRFCRSREVLLIGDGVPVSHTDPPGTPSWCGSSGFAGRPRGAAAGIALALEKRRRRSEFREKPSQTIVDLMDAAHVPLVSNVLALVPSAIEDYVLGYIDEYVFAAL